MNIEELKKKISEIEGQFQMEVSKDLREILFFESKLLETGVDQEFKRDLGTLAEGDPLLGNHKFKRSDYQLAWEKGEKFINTPEKLEASQKRNPLKKIGTALDLANAIDFLLSEKSSWITGQILAVDGGMNHLK